MCRISAGANWFLAFLALTNIKSVLSSVYPTEPVAATTYPTGQLATVKWRDDGHLPHLKNIGLMKIDLHNDMREGNTHVTTLAQGVDPVMQSCTLFIPQDLPTNPHYHMRFISLKPPLTIYTADFKLTRGVFHPVDLKPQDGDPHTAGLTSTPTPGFHPTSQVSVTTIHANPLNGGFDPKDSENHNSSNTPKKSSGKRVDCHRVMFRLAFVLWPTIVGVSFAI